MNLQEYRDTVKTAAGYDPYTETCWGAEAGASSVQLFVDRLAAGCPQLTAAEVEAMTGRKVRSSEIHGRYTRFYLGALYPTEVASSIGEFEPEDQ